MPTYAERRLADGIGSVLSSMVLTAARDSESGDAMVRSASPWSEAARQIARMFGIQAVLSNPWLVAGIGAGGIAVGAFTPVLLRRAWDWAKRSVGIDPDAGTPLPYQDVRRTGPRSDDKWWQRDIPSKVGEVPAGFYAETPDYEPWYLQQQARGTADYKRDVSGLPATFQTLPGYLFRPGGRPNSPPTTSGNPFDNYDAATARNPVLSSESGRRTVMAQQGGFSTNPRQTPSIVGTNPFANMITPDDEESAASIGAGEGFYAPGSPNAPFLDPRFGKADTAEWAPGGTPLETNIRRRRAMMGGLSGRIGQVMNWRVGQILANLKGGMKIGRAHV